MALPNALSPEQRERMPGFFPKKTLNLGLDLQGGAHFLFEIDTSDLLHAYMQDLVDILRKGDSKKDSKKNGSLRSMGIKYYSGLRVVDNDALEVHITDSSDVTEAKKVIKQLNDTDQNRRLLSFGEALSVTLLADEHTLRAVLTDKAKQAIAQSVMDRTLEIMRNRIDELGTREPTIQRQGMDRILVQLPGVTDISPDVFGQTAKLTFHMVDEIGRGGFRTITLPFVDGRGTLAVESKALLTGERLQDAQLSYDTNTGEPVISFTLDVTGAKIFGRITSRNVGKRFAIVIDDEILMAPSIIQPILGGSGQISGNFTAASASQLSAILRSGALPAQLNIIESSTVGAELGADSVRSGAIACLIAFFAVVAYMILCYRALGVFASLALFINFGLLVGFLSVIEVTLTLPGIAGIVLTMGMAVDANVIIFERLREELKIKKGNLLQAMDSGYNMAMSTILDANITTLFATTILFMLGSGPIKGFAITLSIGVVTSVFTAVYVTRLLILFWIKVRNIKTLAV